jgi:RecA-family ATPase
MTNFDDDPLAGAQRSDHVQGDLLAQRLAFRRADAEAMRIVAAEQSDDEEVSFVFTSAEDRRNRPPVTWLIDGLVATRPAVGILFGPEQSYKSFIVAHLAMSLTNGAGSWFGMDIAKQDDQPRHVLIALMEGAEGYPQRLEALSIANPGWDDSRIVTLENQPLDVSLPTRMAALARGIKAHTVNGEPFSPALIVVDTQGLAMGETDENDRSAMRQVYKNARALAVEFRCLVLMVTHPGNTNLHRPAGASSQAQDADVTMRAYRDGTIEVVKCKDGNRRGQKFQHVQEPHGDSLALRWVGDLSLGSQGQKHFAAQRERHNRIVEAVRTLTVSKPKGVSKSDVATAVGGKKQDVMNEIDALLDNGRLQNLSPVETRMLLVTDESTDTTI